MRTGIRFRKNDHVIHAGQRLGPRPLDIRHDGTIRSCAGRVRKCRNSPRRMSTSPRSRSRLQVTDMADA